jgi:hypothetical protein
MRSILPILRYVFIAIALAAATNAIAADPLIWRPLPVGGLNISLVTSGYSFNEASAGDPFIEGRILPPTPGEKTSFVASVCLGNRSRSPIPFTFNNAGPRWTFRIVDSQDQEIWRSDSDIASPEVITEDVLAPGKTWKRSARIPLVIDDTPLAVGIYTLQAFLNADKSVSATTVFEIVPARGSDTGIKGLVERWYSSGIGEVGISYGTPAAGVLVTVTQINTGGKSLRSPFTWTGYTDAQGRFTVNTPPGQYRVTATNRTRFQLAIVDPTPIQTASAEVTVEKGSFGNVYLRLYGTSAPNITQGIKGNVSFPLFAYDPTVTTLSTETMTITSPWKQVGSMPAQGASVLVTQIDPPAGTTPFAWTGLTDSDGRFAVATPPGRFRVWITGGAYPLNVTTLSSGIMAPNALVTTTVEPNSVATINVVLSPGCVIPYIPYAPSNEE